MDPSFISKRLNAKTKSFLLSAVTFSLTAWDLSFNLGAFGEVFFSKIFTAWVTASATFLGCLLLPETKSPVTRSGLLIMAFPTAGLILIYLDNLTTHPIVQAISLLMSIVVYAFCLPYTIYVIFSITQEEIIKLSRKAIARLIIITLIIGCIGYFVGSHNYLFLTCNDFKVSGNDLPANCRPNT